MANIIIYLRTDNKQAIEDHLNSALSGWEWDISLYPTTAQSVYDSMNINDEDEPNWYSWNTYIPHEQLYDFKLDNLFSKALVALNGVKHIVLDVLTSDSTTGEAGEKLNVIPTELFNKGLK